MRSTPRIWRGGSKRLRTTAPKPIPKCREVTVEVLGVAPGIKRFDIVADDIQPTPAGPPPGTEGGRWETIEEALAETKRPTNPPDLWAGPIGPRHTD